MGERGSGSRHFPARDGAVSRLVPAVPDQGARQTRRVEAGESRHIVTIAMRRKFKPTSRCDRHTKIVLCPSRPVEAQFEVMLYFVRLTYICTCICEVHMLRAMHDARSYSDHARNMGLETIFLGSLA